MGLQGKSFDFLSFALLVCAAQPRTMWSWEHWISVLHFFILLCQPLFECIRFGCYWTVPITEKCLGLQAMTMYPWGQAQRVPPAALAREWAWNMRGPFGKSLSTQHWPPRPWLCVSQRVLAVSLSLRYKGARQECKCVSGEAVICVSSRRPRRTGIFRSFLFPF